MSCFFFHTPLAFQHFHLYPLFAPAPRCRAADGCRRCIPHQRYRSKKTNIQICVFRGACEAWHFVVDGCAPRTWSCVVCVPQLMQKRSLQHMRTVTRIGDGCRDLEYFLGPPRSFKSWGEAVGRERDAWLDLVAGGRRSRIHPAMFSGPWCGR
jgi:hypothetical protein